MVFVARTKENLQRCKCMDCPSYTLGCKIKNMPGNLYKLMGEIEDVEHFEGMFCAFEKSNCIEESKGCLCNECEIFHKYRLNRQDFCIENGGFSYADMNQPFTKNEIRV